ncbi:LacI family DNA-binding transcriptional regulator [Sphingomonas floccifaciens]|uniref:LacI family DNA-binding transcriptional regulator n=1 Tax=Sphingomonas floccifaciens TaxID=1844115 RepID=A0ABW4NCP1_9SPHN|nr:LacI family DNA-binding transcriptional regulator [Roseomonas aeriglobus]
MAGKAGTTRGRSMTVNMDDIARLAEVSKPTVSRVLNGSPLVSEATRERVLQVARAHGYAVNRNAQKLRQARTETIAVMLDFGSHRHGRIADPFVFELLAGVSEALSVRNQDLLLSPPGLSDAQACIDLIAGRAADGFIFLGQGGREPMLRDLSRSATPFVVWGAVNPENSYCAVGSDNRLGGRLAGDLFVTRGARRWLFVGNVEHEEIRLRHEGLRQAGDAADASIDLLLVEHMAYSAVYAGAAAWLTRHPAPDAVFAFSDTAAMAVIAAFRDAGLSAPDDYALVGYNNIPPAADFTPAITTIEQETHLAGAILVEKLMQQIEGSRAKSTMLPTRLIVRDT